MKIALTKAAELEELEEVRDNEVLTLTTKMRGKDAEITEAQLKVDKNKWKDLKATRNRELGSCAAKAVEAARQKRKLETGKDDSKGIRRFTWFLDRRASDGKKEIWWSQNEDQGVTEIDLDGPGNERKRIKLGKPNAKDEFELIDTAKERINKNLSRVRPTAVGQTLKKDPAPKPTIKGRKERIVKLIPNEEEAGSEPSEDIIEIDLTEELGGIKVSKPFGGKRKKFIQPKRQRKTSASGCW